MHGPYRVKWLGAGVWAGINEELPAELEGKDVWLTTTPPAPAAVDGQFKLGERVTKTKGSSWTGRVVGTYSTALTPEGYAVESETETGSVQIYPVAALRACLATDKEGA